MGKALKNRTFEFRPIPNLFIFPLLLLLIGQIACSVEEQEIVEVEPHNGEIYTQVSEGLYVTVAVKADGTLEFFTRSIRTMALGRPDMLGPQERFVQAAAGEAHACAIRTNGTVVCFGTSNDYGELNAPEGEFLQIDAGGHHACAVRIDGMVICWGDLNEEPPDNDFVQVSSGSSHACGITFNGGVKCWGSNYHGQSTAHAGRFTQISAGRYHTCGIKSDCSLDCWGDEDGDYVRNISNPPEGCYTQLSAGIKYSCAITSQGKIECWGGRYGERTTHLENSTFTDITTDWNSCGLTPWGEMQCFGPDYAEE